VEKFDRIEGSSIMTGASCAAIEESFAATYGTARAVTSSLVTGMNLGKTAEKFGRTEGSYEETVGATMTVMGGGGMMTETIVGDITTMIMTLGDTDGGIIDRETGGGGANRES
jgi:hypothetical protein